MRTKKLYILAEENGNKFFKIENDEKGYTRVSKCKNWLSASHYISRSNAFNIGATELEMGEHFKILEISIKDFEIKKL